MPSAGRDFKITTGLSRPQCHDLLVMSGMDEKGEGIGLCDAKVTSIGPKWKIQVPLQN